MSALTWVVARDTDGGTRSRYLTLNDTQDGIGWTRDRGDAYRFTSHESASLAARMWYGARVAAAGVQEVAA